MAVGTPVKKNTTTSSSSATSLQASADWTPTAGSLIVILYGCRAGEITVNSVTQTWAGSWSWTIKNLTYNSGSTMDAAYAYAIVPASPGSGRPTINLSGSVIRHVMTILEIPAPAGGWASPPVPTTNANEATGTSTTPSVALTSAAASGSVRIGIVAERGDGIAFTPGSGWTELDENASLGSGTDANLQVQYSSTSDTSSWTAGPGSGWVAAVFEVKEASGQSVNLGLISETDTVNAFSIVKKVNLGNISKTDTVNAFTINKSVSLGLIQKTDSSTGPFTIRKGVNLGQVTEADTAQAMSIRKGVNLGLNTETETVFAITPTITGGGQSVNLGLITETDAVFGFTINKRYPLGLNTETDAVWAMSVRKPIVVNMGLITETEQVFAITVDGGAVRIPGVVQRWDKVAGGTVNPI